MRIGSGFDVHRLEEGIPLKLGGIEIPFSKGLAGHSDGDVLTHAVIDALLGAACLGDIGSRFPPASVESGADSALMLEDVAAELSAAGFRTINVDATVIAESPRLSPYYAAMRERLARALGVDSGQVSLKAKTADGMGVIGQGEAMAAQAVALVDRLERAEAG